MWRRLQVAIVFFDLPAAHVCSISRTGPVFKHLDLKILDLHYWYNYGKETCFFGHVDNFCYECEKKLFLKFA